MTSTESAPASRIVVGVDGSWRSRLALEWAVRLASATGAQVEAVAAWQTLDEYGWLLPPDDWDPTAGAHEMLDNLIRDVCEPETAGTVLRTVERGPAARVLLNHAKDALMLVVGSRGHGTLAGLLIGSVSARAVEHATCPVLVVHGKDEPALTEVPAAVATHAQPVWG